MMMTTKKVVIESRKIRARSQNPKKNHKNSQLSNLLLTNSVKLQKQKIIINQNKFNLKKKPKLKSRKKV